MEDCMHLSHVTFFCYGRHFEDFIQIFCFEFLIAMETILILHCEQHGHGLWLTQTILVSIAWTNKIFAKLPKLQFYCKSWIYKDNSMNLGKHAFLKHKWVQITVLF